MHLILAEKPKVAQKIAYSLSDLVGPFKRRRFGNVSYFISNSYVVAPAVGHIFALAEKKKSYSYPVFDIEWQPSFKVSKSSYYTKAYISLLNHLSKDTSSVIVATDYDLEGSLIGYNVARFIFPDVKVERMKFSTLVPFELKNAFNERREFDYLNAYAGEARHIVDWFYGINISRALMSSLKKAGNIKRIMSIGRVQGPTLAIVAERGNEINSFTPKPYWIPWVLIENVKFEYEKAPLFDKGKAQSIHSSIRDTAKIVDIFKEEKKIYPSPPFNLTDLQMEVYRIFKISPSQTLSIAQSLYENGYISYPRTSSQKLPPQLGLKNILQRLSSHDAPYASNAKAVLSYEKIKPRQGKKKDDAHPAIHPTGVEPKNLSKNESHVYSLIVLNFISVFMEPAVKETVLIKADTGGNIFIAKGSSLTSKGWMSVYKYALPKDTSLPEFIKREYPIQKKGIDAKKTKPPSRYSSASLVSELEKRHLGTKATRAIIVDTLFKRGYITSSRGIHATHLGMAVYNTLSTYIPSILDENLTRKLERDLDAIQKGKKEKDDVINEAKEILINILDEFKSKEEMIGKALLEGLNKMESETIIVGKCPKCGGDLRIINTGKSRFIGCSNYPKCDVSFPLPRSGFVKPTGKVCEVCGSPIVEIKFKGRKPFLSCVNPNCPSKKHKK